MNYLRDDLFVINCAARTGSTMLVHMLRTNPAVLCHGEVYTGEEIGTLTGRYAEMRAIADSWEQLTHCYLQDPERFFYFYLFDLQGKSAAGFKFKTSELFDPRYARTAELLALNTHIKVLHLYRADMVAQYVSHQIVLHQTGLTVITRAEDRPAIKPFALDPNDFATYVADVFKREQASLDFYAKHRGHFLSYEELVAHEDGVLNALQEFIGVPPVRLSKKTEKIVVQELSEIVLNLGEIRDLYVQLSKQRPIQPFA